MPAISYPEQPLFWLLTCSGEICGFRIHGQNVPFEAVVLDKSTGEGVIRAKDKLDCELQKEHTFTIQAYDCGEGPDGANMKKSHKWVNHCHFRSVSFCLNQVLFNLNSVQAIIVESSLFKIKLGFMHLPLILMLIKIRLKPALSYLCWIIWDAFTPIWWGSYELFCICPFGLFLMWKQRPTTSLRDCRYVISPGIQEVNYY